MKNKKRLLWFVLAIIAICFILLLAFLLNSSSISRRNSNFGNPQSNAEVLEMTQFKPIKGTSISIAKIEQERSWSPTLSERWFSFDSGYTVRNLVFLDANTLSSNYLFDTNENFVVDISQFPLSDSRPNTEPIEVKWLVFKIAKEDTNSDGIVNGKDTFSVAVSNATGQNYVELTKNINFVYGMDFLEDHYLLLVYKTNGSYLVSKIDLNQKIILETQKLAQMPSEKVP